VRRLSAVLLRPLRRIALTLEGAFAAVRPRDRRPPLIETYGGYATPDTIILRGRVLTALRRGKPEPEQTRLTNFLQMISLFLTSEVAGVPVRAGEATARSDEEGYFRLTLPRAPSDGPGWIARTVRIAAPGGEVAEAAALIADPDAPFLVISDIDDTVLRTGAHSLARNLWTSLTGNALTRELLPDSVALLAGCAERGAPIYYVSSSPWNLHHFLETLLAAQGAPPGPLFLRDFGLAEDQFVTRGHDAHKSRAIDAILAAIPTTPVVLLGDTGQEDARIYAEAAARWPRRVLSVALREAGGGRDAHAQWLSRLRDEGVVVHVGPTLPTLGGLVEAIGLDPAGRKTAVT
jgi:phosphatidate phosphatase APP1